MSSRTYQMNTFNLLLNQKMEERTNELIQLQSEFIQVFGKEVPSNKKNDIEWIASKIAEAKKSEEENTTNPDGNSNESDSDNDSDSDTESEDGFKEDEDRFNTEEDEESDEVVANEDYDDNSVDNQVMTQEARKVGNTVYPI